MITYIKRKYYENKVKLVLYSTIAKVMEERRGILELASKLYTILKDTPEEELKEAFIRELTKVVSEVSGEGDEDKNKN